MPDPTPHHRRSRKEHERDAGPAVDTSPEAARPWASPMLASLLEQVANQPGALDSYVIAHTASMAITEIRALAAERDAAQSDAAAARKRVQQLIADFNRQVERTDEQRAAYEAALNGMEAERNAFREALSEIASAYTAHGYSDAMDAFNQLRDLAREAINAKR